MYLTQPKSIDVKHNGRVVRRIIARRQTIYPSTRRRPEYQIFIEKFILTIKTLNS